MARETAGTPRSAMVLLGIGLLAGSAFVGGAWWGAERATTIDESQASDSVPERAIESGTTGIAAGITAAPASTIEWPPLPSLDTPLAEVFDELTDRARRGDARAACRLGATLQRCAQAREQRHVARDIETEIARRNETPNGVVAMIDRAEGMADKMGAGCDGLVSAQFAQAYQWQKHAAMLDPNLRVAFALSPALERRDFVNQLDLWNDYRSLAMPWLEAAAKEGDAVAVIALARIHGDMRRTSPPLPPFRIEDDERFVTYADLMQRYGIDVPVVIREAAEKRERLPPEARQRATTRADELFRADLPLPDEAAAKAAMSRSLRGLPDEEFCEEGQPSR